MKINIKKLNKVYRYPNSDKLFVLKNTNGMIFNFQCGHWCTDNVFIDLIDVKLNKYVYELMPCEQLSLSL